MIAPDSPGSTPPPAGRTRKSKKATNNALPSESARPRRDRPNVPPSQLEITAAQLPGENHESTEERRLSVSPAPLTTGNHEDIEAASGTLPLLLPVDPVLSRDSVSQSRGSDVENLERFEVCSSKPPSMPLVGADREHSEPSSPLAPVLVATVPENHERFEVETTLTPYTLPITTGIVEPLEVQNQPDPMTSSFNDAPERSEVEVARVCAH